MSYFPALLEQQFEGLHLLSDAKTGLRALIGLHNTKLGPGLGGTRALATYSSESDAAMDALRLARGMTYKAALAGLPHGGGKAVVMLPKGGYDRAKLFESFGRAVDSLGGRYITTEDSGTSPDDMAYVRRQTRYVVGLEGKSGDPSPVTAFGVVRGMEAAARHVLGTSDLKGVRVTLLGVGHVGYALAGELHARGAKVWAADINAANLERAVRDFRVTPVSEEALLTTEADIFAPCALGGAINDATRTKLRVKIVAGAANNQLADARQGKLLADSGIVYCPDYAINAGGLINCAQEWAGYDREKALSRAGKIYDTILSLLERAKSSGRRPEEVADQMVEERLA